jgi:biopolymer transport protein TolR
MRRSKQSRRRLLAEINVVPYIDVMLVLLVIFMITTPLLSQGVHVNLPKARAKAITMKKQLPIVVTVDKQGRYYVNVSPTPAVPVTSQQLVNLIAAEEAVNKQAGHHVPVYVKGDTAVNYGSVVDAMVLLQKAGVSQVGLLTKSPQTIKVKHAI